MKSLTIALKDLTRSFRSTFALMFMFGIPLIVTGMFYLMFGNVKSDDSISIAATNVVLVNLDEGAPETGKLGDTIAQSLQNEQLASIMQVSSVDSEAEARQMVNNAEAGVAIIIPADFSQSFIDPQGEVEVGFISDPTLTLGPQIVKSVLHEILDIYSGVKITVAEAIKQNGSMDAQQISGLIQQYMAGMQFESAGQGLVELRSPSSESEENLLQSMVAPIMAGMMIFFAFFTGANTANSILHEDEEGTLQRLFTTPTSQIEILRGKVISVGLTVLVQVVILIIAARLLFGIAWGPLAGLILSIIGLVLTASSFGILACSLLKNTRQSGVIFGGLLTVTGMLGMINIFTGNPQSSPLGIVPLFTPQGWVARALLFNMDGAVIGKILPLFLAMLAISAVFFLLGVWRFQKRFA